MANTLRFKRGLVSGIPTALAGEPLFTTDTFDLYIGNGTGNTRFQKYIASGTTSQLLRGDGSLLTMPIVLTSPSNGQVLKYNGTSWVNDSDAGITGSGTAGQVAYFTGATTQSGSNNLFWDNTNVRLGIGTNNPSYTFHTISSASTIGAFRNSGAAIGQLLVGNTAADLIIRILASGDSLISSDTSKYLAFGTNGGTERMRLDVSGNLGLGVTPSAWSGSTGFQIGYVGSINGRPSGSGIYLSSNVYFVGDAGANGANARYIQSTSAGSYSVIGNNHYWLTSPSGTQGTAITWTTPMTLTANGRLLLGTTTEGTQLLQVAGDGFFSGGVVIGSTSSFLVRSVLVLNKNITGSVSSFGVIADNTIQSDVTNTATIFRTNLTTQAAAFTLSTLNHFSAHGVTIGAGSTVSNQFGYFVDASLTTATNNYGFYGNIASGTGRWNLYMNGTANNYLAGSLGIGATGLSNTNLNITKNLTGSTNTYGIFNSGSIRSDVTFGATMFSSSPSIQNAVFTLPGLKHFEAVGISSVGSATITTQFGFFVESTLSGATTNYGFYGNIAAATGRWNIFMDGTANNFMRGSLLVGTSTTSTGEALQVNGTMKVTSNATFGTLALGTGMYWDNTNNRLGIGMASPTTQLHVRNATGSIVTIESTNAGSVVTPVETSINFNGFGANLQGQISIQDKQANQVGGWFYLRLKDASNVLQDRFIIDRTGAATFSSSVTAGGNLLVGSTTAGGSTTPINISLGSAFGTNTAGSTANLKLRLYDDGVNTNHYGFGVSSNLMEVSFPSSIAFFNGASASRTERMRINASGRVLIGSSTDSGETFQVTGTMKVTGASTFTATATRSFSFGTNTDNNLIVTTSNASGDSYTVYENSADANNAWAVGRTNAGGFAIIHATGATYGTGTLTARLTIDSVGAATFSSSVTAASLNINAGTQLSGFRGTLSSPNAGQIYYATDNSGWQLSIGKLVSTTYTAQMVFKDNATITTTSDFILAGGYGLDFINGSGTTVTAMRSTAGGASILSTTSTGTHIVVGTEVAGDLILASNNTERIRLSSSGFFSQLNATNPSSSITDSYIQYSADVVAGNAAPHFRTENGAVVKLYQETTGVGNAIFSQGGGTSVLDDSTFDGYTLRQIVKALRNQGILQ